MADIKISALPTATTVENADELVIVQGGVTKNVPKSSLDIDTVNNDTGGGNTTVSTSNHTAQTGNVNVTTGNVTAGINDSGSVILDTGTSAGGDPGPVLIKTGGTAFAAVIYTEADPGEVIQYTCSENLGSDSETIFEGSLGTTVDGGPAFFQGGEVDSDSDGVTFTTGAVTLQSGVQGTDLVSNSSINTGAVTIQSPNSAIKGTGANASSGAIAIKTGTAFGTGTAGTIDLTTGNSGTGVAGSSINLTTGTATGAGIDDNSGDIILSTGAATGGGDVGLVKFRTNTTHAAEIETELDGVAITKYSCSEDLGSGSITALIGSLGVDVNGGQTFVSGGESEAESDGTYNTGATTITSGNGFGEGATNFAINTGALTLQTPDSLVAGTSLDSSSGSIILKTGTSNGIGEYGTISMSTGGNLALEIEGDVNRTYISGPEVGIGSTTSAHFTFYEGAYVDGSDNASGSTVFKGGGISVDGASWTGIKTGGIARLTSGSGFLDAGAFGAAEGVASGEVFVSTGNAIGHASADVASGNITIETGVALNSGTRGVVIIDGGVVNLATDGQGDPNLAFSNYDYTPYTDPITESTIVLEQSISGDANEIWFQSADANPSVSDTVHGGDMYVVAGRVRGSSDASSTGGNLILNGGDVRSGGLGAGGNVTIQSGKVRSNSNASVAGNSGVTTVKSGNVDLGTGNSGNVVISTGAVTHTNASSGSILLQTSSGGATGGHGGILFQTGQTSYSGSLSAEEISGDKTIHLTMDADAVANGAVGEIKVAGSPAETNGFDGGAVHLQGGAVTVANGGTNTAGDVVIRSGGDVGSTGTTVVNAGDIIMEPGAAFNGGTAGNIIMQLPSSASGLPSGALWSNSGVVTIVA